MFRVVLSLFSLHTPSVCDFLIMIFNDFSDLFRILRFFFFRLDEEEKTKFTYEIFGDIFLLAQWHEKTFADEKWTIFWIFFSHNSQSVNLS